MIYQNKNYLRKNEKFIGGIGNFDASFFKINYQPIGFTFSDTFFASSK